MSDLALTTQLVQNLTPVSFTREKNISKLFEGMASEQRDAILSKVIQTINLPNVIKIKTVQSKDARMFYAGDKNKNPYDFSITLDELNSKYYSIFLGGVVANFIYSEYMKPKGSKSSNNSKALYATKPKPLQNFNEKLFKAEDFIGQVPPDLDAINLILSQEKTGVEPVETEHQVYVLFVPRPDADTSQLFIGSVKFTIAQWLAPGVKESILPLLGGGSNYTPNVIDKNHLMSEMLGLFMPDAVLPTVNHSDIVPTEELKYLAWAYGHSVNPQGTSYVNFPTEATDPYFKPKTREEEIYMLPFLVTAQLIKDNLLKIVEKIYADAITSTQIREVKEVSSTTIPVTAVLQDSTTLHPHPVRVQAPVTLPAPTPLVQPAPAQVAPPVQVNTVPPIGTVDPPVAVPMPQVPVAPPEPPPIVQPVAPPAPVVTPQVVAPAPVAMAPPQIPAGLPTAPPNLDFISPLAIPDLGSF